MRFSCITIRYELILVPRNAYWGKSFSEVAAKLYIPSTLNIDILIVDKKFRYKRAGDVENILQNSFQPNVSAEGL